MKFLTWGPKPSRSAVRMLTAADILNPFIVAENPQSLGDLFVDAAGINFNRMFNLLAVETVNFARPQGHDDDLSHIRFFFVKRRLELR
jgi:hypothetical protein